LLQAPNSPIGPEAEHSFTEFRIDLDRACLHTIQEGVPFEIGTDASDNISAAVLSQGARPVVFMSLTTASERNTILLSTQQTTAVIEAVR